MTFNLLLSKIACKKLMNAVKILPKIAQICDNRFFNFFFAILGSNYTDFIKYLFANLSKTRRMIIDCQLNSLLENCLKPQLVGFRWADVVLCLTEPRWALQPQGTQWFSRIGLFVVQAIILGPYRRPIEFLTSWHPCGCLSKIK